MKILSTALFLLAAATLAAQEPATTDTLAPEDDVQIEVETPTGEDTTKISVGSTKIVITQNKGGETTTDTLTDVRKEKRKNKYKLTWWNGIDLGVNTLAGEDYDFDLDDEWSALEPNLARSRYIAFNFAQLKGRVIGDYVGFTTGMSVQFYNFKYGGDREFSFVGDSLFTMPTGDKNVTKNKLRVSYLAVPLLLEINTSSKQSRSFHLSAGVVGKLKLGNMYKQKYDLDGNFNKVSVKGDLGLNTWGLDAMARVGYGWFTLYGQASLLPLFDHDNAPDLYPVSVGIFLKI